MKKDIVHVGVRWPKMKQVRDADLDCVIQKNFSIKPAELQDFCAKLLTPTEQDLVVLAGAVAYADRKVRRKRAEGWRRELLLTVPVSDPKFWNKPEIMTALIDAVDYVSGDHWSFHFVEGFQALVTQQSSLDFTRGNYVVLPFSDGMDSFLQWQLLRKEEPNTNVLRVHTSSRASNGKRNRQIDLVADKADQRLAMPVSLSVGDHAEPTYRTRTFLFFVMAALASHKSGSTRIVIGENGVGMMGPSMVPFGDEAPHRTTHPAFTQRIAVFLNRVLGGRITFEHPQQFLTKGQVLRRAVDLGVTGWEKTHSCTLGPRHRLDKKACGICGGCLLRRTAVHAAGLKDDGYFWNDLSGKTLDDCRSDAGGRSKRPSDDDIATHGIFGMTAFSELGHADAPGQVFERAAWELVGKADSSLEHTAQLLRTLAWSHAGEWEAFRTRYASDGFLNGQQDV